MSSLLYRLALTMTRHARAVLLITVVFIILIGAGSWTLGGKLKNNFTIPGTQSQIGMDILYDQFPALSGATAQVVFHAKDGSPIRHYRQPIEQALSRFEKIDDVVTAVNPFRYGLGTHHTMISHNGRYALVQVQLRKKNDLNYSSSIASIQRVARSVSRQHHLAFNLGGTAFTKTEIEVSGLEAVGVVLALIVLGVVFQSIIAAGLPIISALIGVGITMAIIMGIAAFTNISTTTPTLAIMLGLAVGIDYALFIVNRHRQQLRDGYDIQPSIAFALATSGGAILFAGLTVIIALCGLMVANIPFLTGIGLCAAIGVGLAVLISLTFLPALLMVLGVKLRPRRIPRDIKSAIAHDKELSLQEIRNKALDNYHQTLLPRPGWMCRWWVGVTTSHPVLTIVFVIVIIAVMAYPAKDLALALPDNGTARPLSQERVTYDLVAKEFGPGANGPLVVMADVINSMHPTEDIHNLSRDISHLPGVDRIQLATPNHRGTIGVVVAVPTTSQDNPATAQLVQHMRQQAPTWEKRYHISHIRVTGLTAVAIDISQRLAKALLPFGIVVVGLSLILLLIVFRSILVPIKATIGYIFSICAAFGVTSLVFTWGWGNNFLGIGHVGTVISFMPIVIMGVLFGLAMDYEVFLVSRMREEYVQSHQPRRAIIRGFNASAPVVTAAALIMISVFSSFIPGGSYYVQPIALGLAVGVSVDAFLVRMTFVPAVMVLLQRYTWWIPEWLDKHLPHFDVEGNAITRRLAYEQWEKEHGKTPIILRHVSMVKHVKQEEDNQGISAFLRPQTIYAFSGNEQSVRAILCLIAGRVHNFYGDVCIDGRNLHDDIRFVHRRVLFIDKTNYFLSHESYFSSKTTTPPIVVIDISPTPIDKTSLRFLHQLITTSINKGGSVIMRETTALRLHLSYQCFSCDSIYREVLS